MSLKLLSFAFFLLVFFIDLFSERLTSSFLYTKIFFLPLCIFFGGKKNHFGKLKFRVEVLKFLKGNK